MNTFEAILSEIDIRDAKLEEGEIHQLFQQYRNNCPEDKTIALESEILAFAFCEGYELSNWKLFYRARFSATMPDGTIFSLPNLDQISEEILDYWHKRSIEALNPILKMRYAGLTWNYYKSIKNRKPPIQMAEIIIDSVADIANEKQHKHEVAIITKLKYALNVALSINDKDRVENITHSILEYEENAIKGDRAANAWSISFDHLLSNKKIPLTEEQRNKIINRIESRLDNLIKAMPLAGGIDPIREAAIRLAKYYQNANLPDKVKIVLLKYTNVACKMSTTINPIVSQHWLSEALATIKDYSLNDEEKIISVKLQEINMSLDKHLHTIRITTQIHDADMQKFLNEAANGTIGECLQRMATGIIEDKSKLQQQVIDLSNVNPLSYVIARSITDHKGRQIATIGPLNEDMEGHLIWQLHVNTRLTGSLRRMALSKIFVTHQTTAESLTEYICRSPFFDINNKTIIETGLDAYLKSEPITAIHVLTPQIEDAIRNILSIQSLPVLKHRRDGGVNLKILDELLREKAIITHLGEDTAFSFRALLTDPRGGNLRNDVCHGTINPKNLTMHTADLIFLILSKLSELQLAP